MMQLARTCVGRCLCRVVALISLICLSLTSSALEPASASDPNVSGTLLLRNVTLLKSDGQAEDIVVHILIRDNKVDVVTQEEIAADTVDRAFDARKGVLLGKLEPGQPPNFLILDGDPRENSEENRFR